MDLDEPPRNVKAICLNKNLDEPTTKHLITLFLHGKYLASVVCWILGNGSLFAWNSMLTIQDYYVHLFPKYHPSRVLPLVYQPFAVGVIFVLAYYESKINTRLRNLIGYSLFFFSTLLVLILNLITSSKGGVGSFLCTCVLSGLFGVADAHVQGGMMGDLFYMKPEFIQSFLAGVAASGALTSTLRLITKAIFDKSKDGLRRGAVTFFVISSVFELVCLMLYAFVFPNIPIVEYYRKKAASEGCTTVSSIIAPSGSQTASNQMDGSVVQERKGNKQLLMENIDYLLDILMIYVLTLSIYPGFLSEDTGAHSLGSWYPLVLIAMFNMMDLIGRYIPLLQSLRLESRRLITTACAGRFLLIPVFYFVAKYGTQGWMITLSSFLGLSNGYLTVCIMTSAPRGYKGPEQNYLGNLLVLFMLSGIFAGVTLDLLWLIGKGW